jgi:prepilin-type N-terminal cleavage/methylation domain-containing protein
MRFHSKKDSRGFTLLELIIVMVIAGLGLSIVGFAAAKSYEKSMLRQDAARLHSMMRYARELAIICTGLRKTVPSWATKRPYAADMS